MKAKVYITLKNGVLDPQGVAIASTLEHLGFSGVSARVGKLVELELSETNEAKAKKSIEQMCEKLLANTVIEKYSVEIVA